MRWIMLGGALAVVFLLMVGSLEPADLVLALPVGALGALTARAAHAASDEPAVIDRMRLAGAPRFAVGAVAEVVSGTRKTLGALLRPGPERGGQIVEISLANRSDAASAVDGLVISTSPGTMVILAEGDRQQRMLVHAIEVASPEQIRRDIDRFYERYQKSFLP